MSGKCCTEEFKVAAVKQVVERGYPAAKVAERLRDTAVEHIDQTHESDAAFLRRLGRKYDAVARCRITCTVANVTYKTILRKIPPDIYDRWSPLARIIFLSGRFPRCNEGDFRRTRKA